MLVDANLLLYATDETNADHEQALQWLTDALNGDRRVAIPWQNIGAFLRISTHPRIYDTPLASAKAWGVVQGWLGAEPTWIPPVGVQTARILGVLMGEHQISANLVPDAMLVAVAIEHGLTIYSADSDFARFPEVPWVNPLRT